MRLTPVSRCATPVESIRDGANPRADWPHSAHLHHCDHIGLLGRSPRPHRSPSLRRTVATPHRRYTAPQLPGTVATRHRRYTADDVAALMPGSARVGDHREGPAQLVGGVDDNLAQEGVEVLT
jgi:hypothetical protein